MIPDPTIIVALIALVGTVVTGFLAWRGQKANARANEAKAYAEQVGVAVTALTTTVSTLHDQGVVDRTMREALEQKVASLEENARLDRMYEQMLVDHINKQLPPPPPERPARVY